MTTANYTPAAINLTEVKAFCRVDTSADDSLLTFLYNAACEEALSYAQVVVGTATVTVVTNWADFYSLPFWPIGAITHVKVDDVADTEYTLLNGVLTPSIEGDKLEVVYAAGYGANTPKDIIHAIYQRVKYGYDYGDDLPQATPRFFDRVLFRYKNTL